MACLLERQRQLAAREVGVGPRISHHTVLPQDFSDTAYAVLFLGMLLEEDAAIVPAAFLVHQGRLRFDYVLAVSVMASLLFHQVLYLACLRWGNNAFGRLAARDARCARLRSSYHGHYQTWLLLSRFMWGLRYPIVSLAALTSIRFWEFFVIDLAGAVLWAITMLILGFYFGDAIEALGHHIRHYDREVAGLLCVAMLVAVLAYKRRKRKAPLPTAPESLDQAA
jgi:membrane protein DedA with SNARE-associated domain